MLKILHKFAVNNSVYKRKKNSRINSPKSHLSYPKKANSHKSFRKPQNKEPTHSVEVKAGKLRQQSKFILCSNLAIYFIWNHQIATISKPNFRHDPLKSLLQCLQNGFSHPQNRQNWHFWKTSVGFRGQRSGNTVFCNKIKGSYRSLLEAVKAAFTSKKKAFCAVEATAELHDLGQRPDCINRAFDKFGTFLHFRDKASLIRNCKVYVMSRLCMILINLLFKLC